MDRFYAINWKKAFDFAGPQFATVLIAMIPLAELRGAIPVAYFGFKLPLWQAALFAVIGNMIPIPFILLFLGPASEWLMKKSKRMDRFFNWLFDRTRKKLEAKYEIYAEVALGIFVAIPLPLTGAWTGAVAAFIFDIPFKKALLWIFLGVLGACAAVTAVCYFLGPGSVLYRIFTG